MDQVEDEFPMEAKAYEILCEIGVSEHTMVYKAICESMNSTVVAVKVVDMDGLNMGVDESHAKNTINSLSQINHANILSPHCCFTVDNRHLWIVMPFIHAGSLESVAAARFQNGLPGQFLATILRQLLSGLVHLHQLGHVHKNIKPSNIFLDSEATIKLSDVNVFNPIKGASDSVPYWEAPELGRDSAADEYSFKSDVWAVGVVALELASGCLPFTDWMVLIAQFLKISRRFPYRMDLYNFVSKNAVDWRFSFSDSFKDFVGCCLVKDPSKRASAASLSAHPFVELEREGTDYDIVLLLKSIVNGKDMVGGIQEMFRKNEDRLKWLMDKKRTERSSIVNDSIGKTKSWEFINCSFKLKEIKRDHSSEKKAESESESEWESEPESESESEEKEEIVDEARVMRSLRESLNCVITQFGVLFKRELEMVREIERLKGELGVEKERSFELELVMRREIQRLKAELGVEKDRNFHLTLGYRYSEPQKVQNGQIIQ